MNTLDRSRVKVDDFNHSLVLWLTIRHEIIVKITVPLDSDRDDGAFDGDCAKVFSGHPDNVPKPDRHGL